MAKLNWRGKEIRKKLERASVVGINDVMARAVTTAKQNHPGWKNRTGTAEASVRINKPAFKDNRGIVGRWGSAGVGYVLYLEVFHGSFLRSAAAVNYRDLAKLIKRAFRGI